MTRFHVDRLGKIRILHVIGTVDVSNSSQLAAAMDDAVTGHLGPLIVSFVECVYADAACARVLLEQFALLGRRLLIIAPLQSPVSRVLETQRHDLSIYEGFRAALTISSHCENYSRREAASPRLDRSVRSRRI